MFVEARSNLIFSHHFFVWLLLTSFTENKFTEFMQCLGILLVFVPENNVKQSKVIGMNNKRKSARKKCVWKRAF